LILPALAIGLVANALVVLGVSARRAQLRALVSGTLVDRLWSRPEPDEYGRMLAWVAARVPENAGILMLAGPRPDYGRYYRASYELVPRRVWLAGGPSSVTGPSWSVDAPGDRDAWRATIERYGIDYLLLLDSSSPDGLRATGFDRIASAERYPGGVLVAVARQRPE
jgi:hypothetical protein